MNGEFANERRVMTDSQIRARGVRDLLVLAAVVKSPAISSFPRACGAAPTPTSPCRSADGQTISQPYIVAYMTEALGLTGGERVLEVGTGSGYQTAVLAEIVREVYTIEIVEGLSLKAHSILDSLGYANIHYRVGDGSEGWPESAPFDAIMVTAAAAKMPESLEGQLGPGGG